MIPTGCPCCDNRREGYLWHMCDVCRLAATHDPEHFCQRDENLRPCKVNLSNATAWQALSRVRNVTVEDIEKALGGGLSEFHPQHTREQAQRVHALILSLALDA